MQFRKSLYTVLFIITILSAPCSCREAPEDEASFVQQGQTAYQTRESTPTEIMDTQENLKRSVVMLSNKIGSRGYRELGALEQAADFITGELREYGYAVSFQPYKVQGTPYKNIYTEIKGDKAPEKLLVIGAHYDTVTGTPGADDNASGVAGLLELARLLYGRPLGISVQFVAFTLEEPPFFRTRNMGSYHFAKHLHDEKRPVLGMICLESIGYYTQDPGSQFYPLSFLKWFYPDTGNFISLVSNFSSRRFLSRTKHAFTKGSPLPVESLTTFSFVPGVDLSDHWSFWEFGFPALMVTDTAFYRNPDYHGAGDTYDTVDFERMAEVVSGIERAIQELASD